MKNNYIKKIHLSNWSMIISLFNYLALQGEKGRTKSDKSHKFIITQTPTLHIYPLPHTHNTITETDMRPLK